MVVVGVLQVLRGLLMGEGGREGEDKMALAHDRRPYPSSQLARSSAGSAVVAVTRSAARRVASAS